MYKLFALALCASLLSGCAGLTLGRVSQEICARQNATQTGLLLALTVAEQDTDSVRREAKISAIRISLAALERCPRHASR